MACQHQGKYAKALSRSVVAVNEVGLWLMVYTVLAFGRVCSAVMRDMVIVLED
jgi:hypothetical protein